MFGFPIFLVLRLIPRALRMNAPLADRLDGPWLIGSMADGVRGYGEMAMDYDWLWVILAVGVLAPVGVVPFALVRDACWWWREHCRGRREREMAGRQLWEG